MHWEANWNRDGCAGLGLGRAAGKTAQFDLLWNLFLSQPYA